MVDRHEPTPRSAGKAALAALSLAQGTSIRATARALEIGERTLRRWMKSPTFRARVERLRGEMIDGTLGKLVAHAAGAVDTLAALMAEADTDATRLSAARAILDKLPMMSEYYDLLERVRALEAAAEDQQRRGTPWRA